MKYNTSLYVVRRNVSLPPSLQRRMEAVLIAPNWSDIACHAWRRWLDEHAPGERVEVSEDDGEIDAPAGPLQNTVII